MPPAGFELRFPPIERPQTQVLDRAAILCIWLVKKCEYINLDHDLTECLCAGNPSHGSMHRLHVSLPVWLSDEAEEREGTVLVDTKILLLSADSVNSCSAMMQL
jgi:hypothetical protein